MLRGKKIRLYPTPEQEKIFWDSVHAARWAYNYHLGRNEENYKNGEKHISGYSIMKEITQLKKTEEYNWLNNISNKAIVVGVLDAENAYKMFFDGVTKCPKFKSRRKAKPSFYVRHDRLTKKQNGFKGEKLGIVKTSQSLPDIPKGEYYVNPRISYDGKYWYLSFAYEVKYPKPELANEVIGIDLGVKDLAVLSNGKVYKNINKTARMKKLEKRLKREQRKQSRKIEQNIESRDKEGHRTYKRELDDCKNYQKQKQKIRLIYRRIKNIRHNYLHQTTSEIVKTKPSRIVMEDLNVRGLMKNKSLSKAIREQCFYEFKRQIQYKCENYGIEFKQVPRFYPSSKLCSDCGHKNNDLKLKDRVYICSHCGLVIDRDLNASINLANYKFV